MATNIPPHNLRETIAATIALIDDPDLDTAALMQHIKGPDFPTGGVILGHTGIRDAYKTGRGRVRVRAKAHVEEGKQGKDDIIMSELPYKVKRAATAGSSARSRSSTPRRSSPRSRTSRTTRTAAACGS